MDKTIEVVVVAMVVLVAATVVLFLFQDQTDSFGDFLGNQQSGAQCELWSTQLKNSDCNDEGLREKLDGNDACEIPQECS